MMALAGCGSSLCQLYTIHRALGYTAEAIYEIEN